MRMPRSFLNVMIAKALQGLHVLALKDRQKFYPLLGLALLSALYEVLCVSVQSHATGLPTQGASFVYQGVQATVTLGVLYTFFILMPPLGAWLKWTFYSFFPLGILLLSGLMISQHHASFIWYSLPVLMTLAHLQMIHSSSKWIVSTAIGIIFINLSLFLPSTTPHLNLLILKQNFWVSFSSGILKSLAFVYVLMCMKRYEDDILNLNRILDVEKNSASHDALTGLMNRRSLNSVLTREIARSKRNQASLAVAMLDIDHFKQINDVYGHKTGDDVLIELAQLLRQNLRESDVVARYGGEEFALVLPETTCLEALALLDRLRRLVQGHRFTRAGKSLKVTISLGVTQFDLQRHDLTSLLEEADLGLYQSKRSGRNQVQAYGLGKMSNAMVEQRNNQAPISTASVNF
jgi:diguanylate cyclase (GGDEF)-like protein